MKLNIHQKTLLFSSVILVSVGLICYFLYDTLQKLLASERWVEHTEQTIYRSDKILSLSKDIAIASQLFQLTRDSNFLAPMSKTENLISNDIGELRQLTKDNPLQQQRVDSLNFYIHQYFYFSYRPFMADPYIFQFSQYADRIRANVAIIQEEENRLLVQRKLKNKQSMLAFNRYSVFISVLMVIFTILLLVGVSNYFLHNSQNEKRREELVIANADFVFQNDEKEKRAAELIIANKELVFQNTEKEKRAAELIVANSELAFQNTEKEKRAAELIIANKELHFQNDEKEKRAAELIILNRELKNAEDDIRKLNEDLEYKVADRTAQLKNANTEMESFSYSVSHDLRAPIRAISGYAKILEEDYGVQMDADATTALHSIRHNAKRMGNLIDDLLAFSQLGRKQVAVSEINMRQLVASIIEDLLLEDTGHKIEFIVPLLPPAEGDLSLIKQVWINLLSNAVKYSKYKPKTIINIGSSISNNFVVYHVRDNGAGFDMQYYDKLFGVFQRLHSQEEFEGTGIGLAIVQKIINRHRGKVWAESVPDEGTCFYFSLPDIHS